MKKPIFTAILALLPFVLLHAQDNIGLYGRVLTAVSKMDLTDAYVVLYDNEGNPKDSIRTNMGMTWRNGQIDTLSRFYFKVPRVDSTYVFDVVCEGYSPQTISFTVENIGRREQSREIPTIYLNRSVQLKEVSVNPTKIKFYNKGDTLVYDANAFDTPEGSMLDALIAQLPGVELSDNGQIKVNGEYVESLLLDGKKFFGGDNNIMLENIAAYTVKNIKVYEGVSDEDEAQGKTFNKKLTMDVRLKKEYNNGWLLNAQGSFGTSERYLGRVFAGWFNSEWSVSLIGNVNNLNDNRKPGRNDTWTPENMPSGQQRNLLAGIDYNYQKADRKKMAQGTLMFNQSQSELEKRTDRINFLSGGNTYEKSFSNSNNKSTRINTNHWMHFNFGNWSINGSVNANYSHSKNSSTGLTGSFTQDPDTVSYMTLDEIYSIGKQDLLATVINRSKTRTDGWNKDYGIYVAPSFSYQIPKSPDNIGLGFSYSYSSTKNELWKDYEINYGPTIKGTERLRQFFDNTPNYNSSIGGSFDYVSNLSNIDFFISYSYSFRDEVKDSYMYALDRLEDMGIYGTLPAGYLSTFDPENSYKSRMMTNRHAIFANISYYKSFDNQTSLLIELTPNAALQHRNFKYWRNERDYKLSKTNAMLSLNGWWAAYVRYRFRRRGEEGSTAKYTNTLAFNYQTQPTLPDMFDMVDVVNDSDPLNIYLGNPDLKTSIYQRFRVLWNYSPSSHVFDNTFYINYWYTHNALTRGYTYDTSTGVRYNKMYNVNGNRNFALTNELKWQFGSKKQFTFDSFSEIQLSRYADMIGIDMEAPLPTSVNNRFTAQNIKVSWQIGKSTVGLRCDFLNRFTTSDQPGFNNLNATHVTSGATAQINLPAGFSVNTDFMCYTRRGYGNEQLDTTDPVWNIRVAYCPPRNTKWVFMVDGYDMLHSLNNVSYLVNAAGRVVSYTNVLPRYFLLSVQYRLSIQPKKK